MSSDLLFERTEHLGIVTLSRQNALNALNLDMIWALAARLKQWQADPEVQAVVIKAEPGSKAFCAGGDVRWLYHTAAHDRDLVMSFFDDEYRLNAAIHTYSKPYIALMDGITMGGGVGISLHAAFPIATERFVFAMPETAIGLFPDIGASYLLSRCPDAFGLYLALTGRRIGAEEARALGLVKYIVPHDMLLEVVSLLKTMDLSHHAAAQLKDLFETRARYHLPAPLLAERDLINHFFNQKTLAAIFTSLAASDDPWALDTLSLLQKHSPLSLAVTFEQMRRAKTMSLADCLKMDYCLVGHFIAGTDLYEGIRALLIDKDKNPRWQPDAVDAVTTDMVAKYFEFS